MSRTKPNTALPDLDDDDFAAKLRPLGDVVIPNSRRLNDRISVHTDTHTAGSKDVRKSRLSVAERIEQIEQVRGPKRRFEYLIPVRVGEALAADAASRGQSAATRLFEILREFRISGQSRRLHGSAEGTRAVSDQTQADLSLIALQQNEILDEMRMLRDGMNVTAAIMQRIDGTLSGLGNEIRATRAQESRMDRRARELEGKQQP